MSDFINSAWGIIDELPHLLLHSIKDTVHILPFLFISYLLMEFIEKDDRAAEYRGLDWSLEYDLAINGDPTDTQSAL